MPSVGIESKEFVKEIKEGRNKKSIPGKIDFVRDSYVNNRVLCSFIYSLDFFIFI